MPEGRKMTSVLKKTCAALAAVLFILTSFTLISGNVNSVMRIGFCGGFPLYQYIDPDSDTPTGFHIELMNAIAKREHYTLEFVEYATVYECLKALEDGLIDMALGISSDQVDSSLFLSTNNLSSPSLCLISNNETAAIIAGNESTRGFLGSTEYSHLNKILALRKSQNQKGFGNNTFLVLPNQEAVIEALVSGYTDIAVVVGESAEEYLNKRGVSDRYTVTYNYLTQINYVIALRGTDYRLLRILNADLTDITMSGEYGEIYDRWLASKDITLSRKALKIVVLGLVTLAVGVSSYIIISRRIQNLLRDKVEEKTLELKQTNATLMESLDRIQTEKDVRHRIIEDSPTGMVVIDADHELAFLNRKAEQLSEISGLLDMILERADAFTNTEEPFTVAYFAGDGKHSYRCNVYSIPGDDMNSERLLSIEDVTEETRKREQVFEQEKGRTISMMIAGIAHEIKNPLTAIRAYSQIIPNNLENHEFLESFSTYVPGEVERINRLINNLVNYARPAKESVCRIELQTLLSDSIGLVKTLAKSAGVEIVFECNAEPYIMGSIDKIRQAFVNYLLNAIDSVRENSAAGKDCAVVTVTLSQADKRAIISIMDNGIGMTEAELRQCREPFYSTKSSGTGLGLAIAEQAVRGSHGTVRIESEKNVYTAIYIEFEVCE